MLSQQISATGTSASSSASSSLAPPALPSTDKRSTSPDISSVLGPDGKLLPAEKKQRKEQNLCLFCGSPDHRHAQCPSAPSSGAG
ncbi:hypothetical protein FRC15_006034, partial [Serendipita sp. 397]